MCCIACTVLPSCHALALLKCIVLHHRYKPGSLTIIAQCPLPAPATLAWVALAPSRSKDALLPFPCCLTMFLSACGLRSRDHRVTCATHRIFRPFVCCGVGYTVTDQHAPGIGILCYRYIPVGVATRSLLVPTTPVRNCYPVALRCCCTATRKRPSSTGQEVSHHDLKSCSKHSPLLHRRSL